MPSIKGTASVADPRARSKALKKTKFPKSFALPVQLSKVNKPVLRQWIEQRVTSILGFEDEIVSSTAINLFLPSEEGSNPDPRRAQLDLVGFLGEEESASFAKELWGLLLEAQSSGTGIPRTLLEQKKKELESQRAMAAKAASNPPSASSGSTGRFADQRNGAPSNARHPEMNRFVQEAARRAQAARQLVNDAHQDRNPPPDADVAEAAANGQPTPVPVSPPPESADIDPARKMPINNSEKRGATEERHGDNDRKMSPRERYRNNGGNYGSASRGYYGGDETGRPDRSYGSSGYEARNRQRRSSERPMHQSRSRSFERMKGRDYDDRDRDHSRGEGPRRRDGRDRYRRYRDDDHEIDELEQRLSDLKRQFSKRRDDHALDEEIEDVKDRIHELERRRSRRRKDRSRSRRERDDHYERKRSRRDSPERNRRRSPSPSEHGESSDDSSRSRSPSHGRDGRGGRDYRREREGDRRRDSDNDRKQDPQDVRKRERRDRHSSSSSSSSDRSGSYSD